MNGAEATGRGEHASPDAVRADRHRLMSRVAGDIGHELKNPIHASVINLELVRKRIVDGRQDDALERLQVVSDQVRRVHGVVEGLLKLLRDSKQADGERELDRVVEVVLPLLRAQANSAAVPLEWAPAGGSARRAAGADALGYSVVGLVAAAVSLARGHATRRVRVQALAAPARVRVAVLEPGSGAEPGAEPEAALMALVERLAAAAGLAIRSDDTVDGVSWSSTVILADAANA